MANTPDPRSAQGNVAVESDIDVSSIVRALTRLESAVARKPGFGCSASRSTTVLVDGLRCRSHDGDHQIDTDLPASLGGSDSGPSPSVLLRAALGSCLAMGYRLRAARNGLPITSVQVVVETDSSIAGLLSTRSESPPGPTEVRCRVDITSPAPLSDVSRMVSQGDELSPLLDALSRPIPIHRSLTINEVTQP